MYWEKWISNWSFDFLKAYRNFYNEEAIRNYTYDPNLYQMHLLPEIDELKEEDVELR
jgi:hypothetical protein